MCTECTRRGGGLARTTMDPAIRVCEGVHTCACSPPAWTGAYGWGRFRSLQEGLVPVLRLRSGPGRAVAARPQRIPGAGRRLPRAVRHRRILPLPRPSAASGSGPSTSSTPAWRPRRVHLPPGAALLGVRPPSFRRPPRAHRVQRARRPPSRPTCGPTSTTSRSTRCCAAVDRDATGPPTAPTRTSIGLEPNYRLLHGQHAPGLAEARRRTSWMAHARRRPRRRGMGALRGPDHAARRRPRAESLVETDYPFRDSDHASRSSADAASPLPACSCASPPGPRAPRSRGNGRGPLTPGTFHRLERDSGTAADVLELRFPMHVRTARRYNRGRWPSNAARSCYALKIGEECTPHQRRQAPTALPTDDFETAPDDAVELRSSRRREPPDGQRGVRGAAGRRATVLAGGGGRRRARARPAIARLEAAARLGGRGLAGRRGLVETRAGR